MRLQHRAVTDFQFRSAQPLLFVFARIEDGGITYKKTETFMVGMTSSAAGSAVISLIAAVVVLMWMPKTKRILEEE